MRRFILTRWKSIGIVLCSASLLVAFFWLAPGLAAIPGRLCTQAWNGAATTEQTVQFNTGCNSYALTGIPGRLPINDAYSAAYDNDGQYVNIGEWPRTEVRAHGTCKFSINTELNEQELIVSLHDEASFHCRVEVWVEPGPVSS